MIAKLPENLPGHWDTTHGAHLARDYVGKTREQLCNGKESDMGIAFDVAMLMRNDLNFEPVLTAAKDRIRWLSVQLAIAQQHQASLLAVLQDALAVHGGDVRFGPDEDEHSWCADARAAIAKSEGAACPSS